MDHPYAPCPLNHGPHEGQGALWGSPASTAGLHCRLRMFSGHCLTLQSQFFVPDIPPSQPPLEVTSLLLCYREASVHCLGMAGPCAQPGGDGDRGLIHTADKEPSWLYSQAA